MPKGRKKCLDEERRWEKIQMLRWIVVKVEEYKVLQEVEKLLEYYNEWKGMWQPTCESDKLKGGRRVSRLNKDNITK